LQHNHHTFWRNYRRQQLVVQELVAAVDLLSAWDPNAIATRKWCERYSSLGREAPGTVELEHETINEILEVGLPGIAERQKVQKQGKDDHIKQISIQTPYISFLIHA